MLALTRLMARQGRPQTTVSDNGSNFVGAALEFREIANHWNQILIHQSLAQQSVVWKINPPGAPHFGGVWEHLFSSCKKPMYSILCTRSLAVPVLTRTVCLVERTLNAHPLTPVSDDHSDLQSLTPNQFLLGPRV